MAETDKTTEIKPEKDEKLGKDGKPVKDKKPVKDGKLGKDEKAPPPTLEEAVDWIGMRVDDWNGDSLGKVSGIHVDATSNEPKWLVVKMGRFAGEAAIPFDHVAAAGGKIWAAYERDAVRHSPKLSGDQTLNARQELQLCEHYGIPVAVGRAAEVSSLEGDEISAVPASE